jgi:hypothetical protein
MQCSNKKNVKVNDTLTLPKISHSRYQTFSSCFAFITHLSNAFFFKSDDPMLKYLSKPSNGGDRSNNSNNAPAKPRYRGPDPQKNRYEYKFFRI